MQLRSLGHMRNKTKKTSMLFFIIITDSKRNKLVWLMIKKKLTCLRWCFVLVPWHLKLNTNNNFIIIM